MTAGQASDPEGSLAAGLPDRVARVRDLVEYLLVAATYGDLCCGGGPVP
jgi:hypothetical protein